MMVEVPPKISSQLSNIHIENPNSDVELANFSNITINAHSSFNEDIADEEEKVSIQQQNLNPFEAP
jgi:hypothetical protein